MTAARKSRRRLKARLDGVPERPKRGLDGDLLTWWQRGTSEGLGPTDLDRLRASIKKLHLFGEEAKWSAARNGDADAAVALALASPPLGPSAARTNAIMSVLLVCAAEGDAGAEFIVRRATRYLREGRLMA